MEIKTMCLNCGKVVDGEAEPLLVYADQEKSAS